MYILSILHAYFHTYFKLYVTYNAVVRTVLKSYDLNFSIIYRLENRQRKKCLPTTTMDHRAQITPVCKNQEAT